jgi:hypothetical protein
LSRMTCVCHLFYEHEANCGNLLLCIFHTVLNSRCFWMAKSNLTIQYFSIFVYLLSVAVSKCSECGYRHCRLDVAALFPGQSKLWVKSSGVVDRITKLKNLNYQYNWICCLSKIDTDFQFIEQSCLSWTCVNSCSSMYTAQQVVWTSTKFQIFPVLLRNITLIYCVLMDMPSPDEEDQLQYK